MKTSFFLVVSDTGKVTTKTRSVGKLEENEIAIRMNLNLPSSLFNKPKLNVTLTSQDQKTWEVTQVLDSVKDAIEGVTPFKVEVEIKKEAE